MVENLALNNFLKFCIAFHLHIIKRWLLTIEILSLSIFHKIKLMVIIKLLVVMKQACKSLKSKHLFSTGIDIN